MTVIAWDGTTLAADKLALDGYSMKRTVTKIEKHEGRLYAFTGSWDAGVDLREWHKAGADPDFFPERARSEGEATLIVIDRNGIMQYVRSPYGMKIEAGRAAFGSGRDFAEAAMACGRDAVAAVELASYHQADCGRGVDTLEL